MTKIFFSTNIRFLRERRRLSQEELAGDLAITRNKLQALESGKTINPPVADLLKFSHCFKISVDTLLKIDLSRLSALKLAELEAGNDVYLTGSKIRILAISTDKNNRENIEYVPAKAKMGYKAGYRDPEYVATLPKYSLPGLPTHKTYRIFPSTGESMLPIQPGTDFITEYVEDWKSLRDTPCVLVLRAPGADFVFKFVTYQKKTRDFLLRSLNEEQYPPYTIPAEEVLEVWKYYKHIAAGLPEKGASLQQLAGMMREMKTTLAQLKKR